MARPSSFTPEIANTICERLIEGKSLRSICCDDEMPSASTVCRWLGTIPEFQQQYAHAREAQADTLADEILDISDDGSNDWMEKKNTEGDVTGVEYNGDAVQRSRLRVDSRKWLASKLRPKVYGEKVSAEVSGPDGASLTDETAMAARIAALLALAEARKASDEN